MSKWAKDVEQEKVLVRLINVLSYFVVSYNSVFTDKNLIKTKDAV